MRVIRMKREGVDVVVSCGSKGRRALRWPEAGRGVGALERVARARDGAEWRAEVDRSTQLAVAAGTRHYNCR